MKKVYITGQIPQTAFNMLRGKGLGVDFNGSGRNLNKSELKKILGEYNAVLTLMTDKIDEEVIRHASSSLKIITNYAVGYDNIDVLAAKRKGIVVTNTPNVAGEAVAEYTMMLIFACSRRLIEADRFMRRGKYHRWDPLAFLSNQLWGKTIGIIGLGRIGTYVGHMAYGGFKMNILYYDIVRAEDFEMLTEAKFSDLNALLKNSDVVTLHIPLTGQTHHLIGKEELKLMKKTAVLINTSRGPVIDEKALIWALENGEIAAAGLDVFEHEPDIPSELATMSNVVLTPHISSATVECREAMAKIAAQNIIDVFEGRTPAGLVKVG